MDRVGLLEAVSRCLGRDATGAQELSDAERRNLLLRCELADGKTVIVKQPGGDDAIGPGFWRDLVGAELVSALERGPHCAKLLGSDTDHGFIVLEDLGAQHGSLMEPLLRGTAADARRVLELFMQRLARVHGASLERVPEYERRWGELCKTETATAWPHGDPQAENLLTFLDEHDPPDQRLRAEIVHAVPKAAQPGPLQSFVHGDPCPDNCVVVGSDLRLIDFEMSRIGLALLDAVYVVSPFPTCWCAGLVPPQLGFELLEIYRRELGGFTRATEDDALWRRSVLEACAAWLVVRLGWLLPRAWEEDRAWPIGSSRSRILSGLEQFVRVSQQLRGTSPLSEACERWLTLLRARWSESQSLATFPAFESA